MQKSLLRGVSMGLLVSGLTLAGCAATRQYFEPTEHIRGRTVEGFKEAFYDLLGPEGHFGEAKLWSHGAYRKKHRGTRIHVAFEVQNTGNVELSLSAADIRVDSLRSAVMFADVAPLESQGLTIAPGAIGELQFHFELPPAAAQLSPTDIAAFRVRWVLHRGAWSYAQRTSFVQERASYYDRWSGYGASYPYAADCWPYGAFDCYGHTPFVPFGLSPDASDRGPRQAVYPAH